MAIDFRGGLLDGLTTNADAETVWVAPGELRYWCKYEREGNHYIHTDRCRRRGAGLVIQAEAIPYKRWDDGDTWFTWVPE